MKRNLLILAGVLFAGACTDHPAAQQAAAPAAYQAGTFGYDLDFLRRHDSVIVLESNQGKAQVVVSAKYQAKVFTSTADGSSGRSFGWIHYKAFDGPLDTHMNGYGGENRLWLGPEGGRFSLFFPKGSKMVFANWHTPAAFDTEGWQVTAKDSAAVTLRKDMQLPTHLGTILSLSVVRSIAILDRKAIEERLQLTTDTAVKMVGYQTNNTLTNTGQQAWTAATGMPCLWLLDMFNPSPATAIIIPYKTGGTGPGMSRGEGSGGTPGAGVATTNYFGEIPSDRIRYENGDLLFKADGKSRGKLGIHPSRAKNMAGSYDAQNKILTLTLFDTDSAGKFLNQEWDTVKPAFSGDAVNAYNDGALADGSQMGPFYEIESVSPAAFLAPGQSLSHKHAVFHFTGDEASLDRISRQLLGIPLDVVKKAFGEGGK